MTTVVPPALMRASSCMMSMEVAGSRFPVGSSASRICGRLTIARAIATRCCSPPDSSCGRRFCFPSKPTRASASGTACWMKARDAPMTCSVKATFWNTVLLGSRRKSWKTDPMCRRKYGTLRDERVLRSRPSTTTRPSLGPSSRRIRRRQEDFPEPDAPTRKTNSPRCTSKSTSLSAGLLVPRYFLVTCSNRIMTRRAYVAALRMPGATLAACRLPTR